VVAGRTVLGLIIAETSEIGRVLRVVWAFTGQDNFVVVIFFVGECFHLLAVEIIVQTGADQSALGILEDGLSSGSGAEEDDQEGAEEEEEHHKHNHN
jgi:hypothetical protein